MIALTLTACTVPWDAPAGDGVFPHPAGYGDAPRPHGDDARADDARCATCHAPTACAECHPSYPHRFSTDAAHPAAVDECLACHADPAAATSTELPCTTCHPSYPHPPGWELGGAHGVYALARGSTTAACGACHGATLAGGAAAVGCGECHPTWPHTAAFDHGPAAVADPSACTGCHGETGGGGTTGVGCATCHLTYPHPAEFGASGHLAVAAERGERTCLVCHDPGDGPPNMSAPCGATCHGATP